jgi:hypothetical protein
MADTKISDLTALTGANTAPDDLLAIVDTDAATTKKQTRQEFQTYNAGTLTTDVKVLDLSATWNDAGVTFTGLKFNVTDTASAAGSLLLDLQVGGTSKVNVNKSGHFTFSTAGSSSVFTLSSGSAAMSIFSSSGINLVGSSGNWAVRFEPASTRLALYASYSLQFASGNSAPDLALFRDGSASTLAQRFGTSAQTFRLYRTWTDASNYQRITNTWSTSTAVIHNEGAGTSVDGSIAFNDAALATDTTKGFIMIPSCAGAPTGTPADIPTGQIPIVFDSTNNKLYVYDGGWISTAALT